MRSSNRARVTNDHILDWLLQLPGLRRDVLRVRYGYWRIADPHGVTLEARVVSRY